MPRSAAARAGASLMPSPTMATPSAASTCELGGSRPALCVGLDVRRGRRRCRPARRSPRRCASLSPVSRTVRRPSRCSAAIAAAESGFDLVGEGDHAERFGRVSARLRHVHACRERLAESRRHGIGGGIGGIRRRFRSARALPTRTVLPPTFGDDAVPGSLRETVASVTLKVSLFAAARRSPWPAGARCTARPPRRGQDLVFRHAVERR